MQNNKENRTYIAYLKDITQDKQYKRLNPQTGSYLKRGEEAPLFREQDLPMLKAYFARLSAINKMLCFQIRDADAGTVVWQA